MCPLTTVGRAGGTAPGHAHWQLWGGGTGAGPVQTLRIRPRGPQAGRLGQHHPSPPALEPVLGGGPQFYLECSQSQPLSDKAHSSRPSLTSFNSSLGPRSQPQLSLSHLTQSAVFAPGAEAHTHCPGCGCLWVRSGDCGTNTAI